LAALLRGTVLSFLLSTLLRGTVLFLLIGLAQRFTEPLIAIGYSLFLADFHFQLRSLAHSCINAGQRFFKQNLRPSIFLISHLEYGTVFSIIWLLYQRSVLLPYRLQLSGRLVPLPDLQAE